MRYNFKNKIDGIELLKNIKNENVKVVFFDPQYRGVLDKLNYGNEGENRGKDRTSLPQMTEDVIENFIKEIERILFPNGYLFLWIDKFHLVEGIQKWFENTKTLKTVDMITWDKGKIGMGYRTRRKSEYLVIIQKEPRKAKSTWTLHNIPDVWAEKIVNKIHPHMKPYELQKQLILATTNENDIIVDPCAGSFVLLDICKEIYRNYLGTDIIYGEEWK